MKVAVCIATYLRSEGLSRLLSGLNQLEFKQCKPEHLEIIVVDNDTNGSARETCENVGLRWPLKYVIESKRGISYARNRAVEEALEAQMDCIVFIDDDEIPESQWLDQLLSTQKEYSADVVMGPVVPYFPEQQPPRWIIKGGFFQRRRYQTGTQLELASTCNVLIRSYLFEKVGLFDERFALSGGEDTHFFARVSLAGYKIVWSDEALAVEWIPRSRANLRWLLQRAYREGNTMSLVEADLQRSWKTVFKRCLIILVRCFIGVSFLPVSIFMGNHFVVKGLRYLYLTFGMLAGLMGRRYLEYQQIHK
jgi:GT2 family glycosyltransferase